MIKKFKLSFYIVEMSKLLTPTEKLLLLNKKFVKITINLLEKKMLMKP